jgi:Site-specific recombinase XerD
MRKNSGVRRKNTIADSGYDAVNLPVEAEDFEVAERTFLRNCKIRNLSGTTIVYYRDVIGRLRKEMKNLGVERPVDVSHEHIHEIMLATREAGAKDATVDKYIRGWRVFFNYMATEGYVNDNRLTSH